LITLFLCGDLMTGRGIDQILPISNTPILIERHVRDARVYIALAGKPNGIIPNAVDYRYVWGDALGNRQSAEFRGFARNRRLAPAPGSGP
jgi:poly-gamma-glutamate synthesis protein (capsule biosynthesis protein)